MQYNGRLSRRSSIISMRGARSADRPKPGTNRTSEGESLLVRYFLKSGWSGAFESGVRRKSRAFVSAELQNPAVTYGVLTGRIEPKRSWTRPVGWQAGRPARMPALHRTASQRLLRRH